ncbi:MAG TPA: hypothetical protein VHD84_01300 [Candidatus Saccharimonadales bacterium]|nr:hypothetical protein [Candidatus Saccharimonadales bacterium]
MRKHSSFKDSGVKKYYILTQPAKLSDLNLDEYEDSDDSGWREKSRQLQARRWRKIRHQLV